ncbi:MAG: hypothetical protein OXB93_04815 [Cytophagales bacterium]|nr:hypothetical protein [Cytophagales bacterium]
MKTAKLNIANRPLFHGNNLDVLQGINSSCTDLISLDPPFNKKKTFEGDGLMKTLLEKLLNEVEGKGFIDFKEDVSSSSLG